MELEARVEIRQPEELEAEELEVFDSLRLSVVVLMKLTAEIVVAAEAAADIAADVAGQEEDQVGD